VDLGMTIRKREAAGSAAVDFGRHIKPFRWTVAGRHRHYETKPAIVNSVRVFVQ
jgi:hypothetical protein